MDVKEKVLEVLNNSAEPLKGGQIAEISGLDKKDVDKAIKALKSEEKIISPKRCFYAANKQELLRDYLLMVSFLFKTMDNYSLIKGREYKLSVELLYLSDLMGGELIGRY